MNNMPVKVVITGNAKLSVHRLTGGLKIGTGSAQYEGEYEVTPTEETQILYTLGMSMRENVTVHPIPTNYGRITWNGSFIMIS